MALVQPCGGSALGIVATLAFGDTVSSQTRWYRASPKLAFLEEWEDGMR